MEKEQFSELMGKLEEIRCGIIDVEVATEKTAPPGNNKELFRDTFFSMLEEKTGWGRNEIKRVFDEAMISCGV